VNEVVRQIVPWFVANGFYILFWLLTLAAFVSPRRAVKNSYLLFFFVSMAIVGLLIGAPVWPFHQWHLWGRMLPSSVDYHEVWLEDDLGQQVIYDLRAVQPLMPAYINKRHAPDMLRAAERGEPDGRAMWLLERANSYRPSCYLAEWIRFPLKDQSHYQTAGLFEGARVNPHWPADHRRFVRLVIKKKRVVFSNAPGYGANFTLLEEVRLP
jgi:hypothetical protein